MSIIITLLFIAIILFRSVRRLLPSTQADLDEPDPGLTPDQILKESSNPNHTPQPHNTNINKNPPKSPKINPQIIEEQPEEHTFSACGLNKNTEDLRKAIIMSEILNRRYI